MHLFNGYSTDPAGALAAIADFVLPGVAWPALAIALAGSLGVIAVFLGRRAASRAVTVKVRKR
jgi:hypothetical protein